MPLKALIVFMQGPRPSRSEEPDVNDILAAAGLTFSDIAASRGVGILRFLYDAAMLDDPYLLRIVANEGYDLDSCTLVPFTDGNGRSGVAARIDG